MRPIALLLFGTLVLGACRLAQPTSEWQGPILAEETVVPKEETVMPKEPQRQAQPITVETILGPEEPAQPVVEEPARPVMGYDERIARNVRVKRSDEYGITYEYKNVRIDEIAHLASDYCYKQKGRQAMLHDSQLFRNFSRRATFDCLELQN